MNILGATGFGGLWALGRRGIESTAKASSLRRIFAKSPATIDYLKTNANS